MPRPLHMIAKAVKIWTLTYIASLLSIHQLLDSVLLWMNTDFFSEAKYTRPSLEYTMAIKAYFQHMYLNMHFWFLIIIFEKYFDQTSVLNYISFPTNYYDATLKIRKVR